MTLAREVVEILPQFSEEFALILRRTSGETARALARGTALMFFSAFDSRAAKQRVGRQR